ncbi:hypothetical protein FI667_g7264, partial [Globisporangium splendens]
MRAWMLVVSILNVSWSCFVALSEARAYHFAKATCISIQETIVIVAGVCFLEHNVVFDLVTKKHKLESQRTWDTDAFNGRTAFYNTYNGALEGGASRIALQVIYDPLIITVLESIVLGGVCLAIKYAFYGMQATRKPSVVADFRVTNVQVIESMDDLDFAPLPVPSETPSPNALHLNASYSHLSLERVLKMPIRANSLVRNSFELDEVVAGQKCIPPYVHLDSGLIMKDGPVRTRRGFRNVIRPKHDLSHYVCPVHAASTDSGSPSKSAIASMKATAVSNLVLATDLPPLSTSNTKMATGSTAASGDPSGPLSPSSTAVSPNGAPPGRRSLTETANTTTPRSMHRRKSINEFTSIQL